MAVRMGEMVVVVLVEVEAEEQEGDPGWARLPA